MPAPIYLDHNATTPIDPAVREAMRPHLEEACGNPRTKGRTLKVGKRDRPLWRYRVGDYRVICHHRDEDNTVLVLRIAHRREVYRRRD